MTAAQGTDLRTANKAVGLSWKRYWRSTGRLWHCFVRNGDKKKGFISLCGVWTIKRVGSQESLRPAAVRRCAACDRLEIAGTGKQESLLEAQL